MAAPDFDHRLAHVTHVTVDVEHSLGPRPVLLKYDHSVVVATSYSEDRPAAARLLSPLDIEGDGIMEVPLAQCRAFHTDEEAETILRCMEADERLLAYARG